jgi:2-oxoglutarate ferredoxin oxidoreductase subunit alpha
VVAFNEQVLLGRVKAGELKPGAHILLESMWREHRDPQIAASYVETVAMLQAAGFRVHEVALERECRALVADPRKGKNMFVLGMLLNLYSLDPKLGRDQIALTFGKKDGKVIKVNQGLLDAGYAWAERNFDFRYRIPATRSTEPQIVVNGNTALALGVLASGMDICAMYPITPATSASHYLSDVFEKVGGIVHQAEDEIAACAFAIGASYAGKCAVTITSGPGYSLKQEGIGLAVMAEIPLVVVNVQRGGPSTGQPTKVEQGDLLTAMHGSHGDAPKVVIAACDIEDCFYTMITARKLAETFRTVVVVLSDASLATAQQPFPRPSFDPEWLAPPVDQTPVPEGAKPYDWDGMTGLARRFVPGQLHGTHTVTGLAHDRASKVAYDPEINEEGLRHRSLKLAALQKTLRTPPVYGDAEGDLLVVGWGSTKGVIEEAVDRMRAEGARVSSLHLTFIQPMPSGIGAILKRFRHVVAVEQNWSDRPDDALIDEENRRYSALALLLRSRFLVDIDCWTQSRGQPIKPAAVVDVLRKSCTRRRRPKPEGKQAMTMPVSQCLIKLHEERHDIEDYQGGVPRWCSGCGDNAILAAVQRLCRDEDLSPGAHRVRLGHRLLVALPALHEDLRLPRHPRPRVPDRGGVKMARPDLAVFVNTGDGDCCSIGAAHWIHAIRYNMNVTAILHDNHVYGLTKKQASPTSPRGLKSNTTPRGSALEALNPMTVTLGVTNVSFVAQAVDWIPELLYDILLQAYRHRGFSFVRIIQRCPEFLPKMFEPWLHDPGRTLLLTHRDGLAVSPELSRTYRNQIEHDPSNIDRAREIASAEDPIAVGILYRNPAVPCYEDLRNAGQMRTAEQIRTGFEAELDKFTVWPEHEPAGRQAA